MREVLRATDAEAVMLDVASGVFMLGLATLIITRVLVARFNQFVRV